MVVKKGILVLWPLQSNRLKEFFNHYVTNRKGTQNQHMWLNHIFSENSLQIGV